MSEAEVSWRAEFMVAARRWSESQRRLPVLAAALDRSNEWIGNGSPTCAHWIADALDVEVCTAREWLRVGRALERFTAISAALASGEINYTKVRALTRIAKPDTEAELVALAREVPANRLNLELSRWLARHESPSETEDRHRRSRGLRWRNEPDGMWVATLRLAPEHAAIVASAVDTMVMRGDTRPEPAAPTDGGRDASQDASRPRRVRWPSTAQQRADALVGLVSGGGTAVVTEVVMHVRGDGCTLDDGTPVAGTVVERIASESFLRVLIHDAQRRPINASGRHRHPSDRQKRVVHERDQGCVDCGSTELLEFDHQPEFAITGHTVVDEVRQRCWSCHRSRHEQQQRHEEERRGAA